MVTDMVVADAERLRVWTFTTPENAQKDLARAEEQRQESIETWKRHCENYPNADFKTYLEQEQATHYSVMLWEEYQAAESKKLLGEPVREINAERFNEMLDVLPPLHWCTINGVEMFCIKEMYTGFYTNQYAHDKRNDKYYTKMVDSSDRSTWINEYIH